MRSKVEDAVSTVRTALGLDDWPTYRHLREWCRIREIQVDDQAPVSRAFCWTEPGNLRIIIPAACPDPYLVLLEEVAHIECALRFGARVIPAGRDPERMFRREDAREEHLAGLWMRAWLWPDELLMRHDPEDWDSLPNGYEALFQQRLQDRKN